MRVVLDTNVWVAALVADGPCRDLVRLRIRSHTIVTSDRLLTELSKTLTRKFSIKPEGAPLLAALREEAELVAPARLNERVCRDKDDDVVLATAIAGRADLIVTGDDDLLSLKKYRDVRIVSPRQFLELVDRGKR